MINLTPEDVRLGAVAPSKTEAIRQVGEVLMGRGRIQPGYIDSMVAREAPANTFLGNGIAIPHGQPAQRDLIVTTGIAVLQIPTGVGWNLGEVVHLVVGIAAKSDEHLEILTNLTHVLDDPEAVRQLVETVVRVLARGSDVAQALTALQRLVEDGLEKEEEVVAAGLDLPALALESAALSGVAASPGLAIAPLHRFRHTELAFADTA